ncbi:hypothetical protein MCP_1213 [Methanocella paludicola SANAE]|uniref:Uncharacterized protein n=1 Tax=Methanocella paludicola (strain DSM 17711 / JCM 13418 / NBRC 101707 / SANAE) TaxID=304371 RepID=D1YXW3_METPS|nr:hypothetical protein [Methanocella paludicola]BAI61285.1 hypothetical protein MCP_1213 [Methanocella paludicola SANAE]
MSGKRSLFGLLIIAALLIAGCTGTKTMAGNNGLSADGQSALKDYQKYSSELKDEISYMKFHYTLSENATLDEYKAWLGGYAEKLDLCRKMYNDTSAASKKYLPYLNNSSEEYRNVTSDDAIFQSDIESLNRSYDQFADYLDLSIKRATALGKYTQAMNETYDAYNDISSFAGGAKVSSEEDYASFLDGFDRKAQAYKKYAGDAVKAGEEYQQFFDPESAEYAAIEENNNALIDSIRQCEATYTKYKMDYDNGMAAKSAAQSAFSDYVDKAGKVSAMKTELDGYRNTKIALDKLDRSWLDGYRQKLDAFNAACNDAIAAGDACKQYLNTTSSEYKSIDDNKKNMQDTMAAYEENYKKIEATYRNLHPLESLKR